MELSVQNLLQLVCDSLNLEEDELDLDISLNNDLGIDSLEVMQLLKAISKTFRCEITKDDIIDSDNIGNLFAFLSEVNAEAVA